PEEPARRLAQEGGERLGRAGIRAWKRADAPAAVNLLSRAVKLLPNAYEFQCELGTALRASNEVDRAESVLLEAAEASEPVTQLRAQIELAFVRSLREPDRVGDLLEVASVAIPILEAMRGRFDQGRGMVARARAIYRELGLESGAVDVCGRVLAAIEMLAVRPDRAAEALRACCELVQRLRQTPLLATRAGALAAALYEQKRYGEAETWTDLARRSAGTDDLD